MDQIEQQGQDQQQDEAQQTSEMLSALSDRLDGIEQNQREVTRAANEATRIVSRACLELVQAQQLMQQRTHSDASANDSHAKALATLATTQSAILELLGSSRSVKLPGGAVVSAADLSGHTLMQKVRLQIQAVETVVSRLADEVHSKRVVTMDYDKLAMHLVSRLGERLSAHEHAVEEAFTKANASVLADLATSRAALSEAGAQVSTQVRQAGEQVEKLSGVVTWRTLGQVATVLLPLSLAAFVVFGMAQTVWAAFGFQPILQTIWSWFLDAQEWYWKLAIAAGAFVVSGAFGCLVWWLGDRLCRAYRRY